MAAKRSIKKHVKKLKTVRYDDNAPSQNHLNRASTVITDLTEAKAEYLKIFRNDQGTDQLISYLKANRDPYFNRMKEYYDLLEPFKRIFKAVEA